MSDVRNKDATSLISPMKTELARARQTPRTDFSTMVKSGTLGVASAVASVAGPVIPGASAVLSAAVNAASDGGTGYNTTLSAGRFSTSPIGTAGGAGMRTGTLGGVNNAIEARAASGDASAQMMVASQQMQEMNAQFNMGYLMLQQKMQAESREYTALSNVMKAKNDTAKNALSNLK